MSYDPEMPNFYTPFSRAPALSYYDHQIVPHEFMLQCTACSAHVSPEGVVKNRGKFGEYVEFEQTGTVRITPGMRFVHKGTVHYSERLERVPGARKPIFVKTKTPTFPGCGGTMRLYPQSRWARDILAEGRVRLAPSPQREEPSDGRRHKGASISRLNMNL